MPAASRYHAPLICRLFENQYFFAMKSFTCWILLVCLLSCTQKPSPAARRPKLVSVDSSILPKDPNPYIPVDISPMDMSYLPADYPKMAVHRPTPVARVIYSRPHKQGRRIFGSLLKFGEPWRLGANEATEIEFFIPVTIQKKTIPKGRYILYCIPYRDHWTMVFNSNLNSWGLTLDPKKDLYRFDIPITKKPQAVEYFSMIFQATEPGSDLVMAWDSVEARLPIQYKEQ